MNFAGDISCKILLAICLLVLVVRGEAGKLAAYNTEEPDEQPKLSKLTKIEAFV